MSSNQIEFDFTFENMTQNLNMFDSEDMKNWQILAYSVSLMVADTISIFMVPPPSSNEFSYFGQENSKEEVAARSLAIAKISDATTDYLLDYCKVFARPP